MANFTFREFYSNFNNTNDDSLMNVMCGISADECVPKKQTLDNIMGYSKALSVRKSKHLKNIKMLLN